MSGWSSEYLARLVAPLRHRQFRIVWAGQFINFLGDAIYAVAVALFLLPRQDAAQALGLVLGMASVGRIISLLLGGVLADRYRGSRVIILADLIRAAGLGGILLLGPEAPVLALAACSGVLGFGAGLYRPAYGALLMSLVPPDCIPGANAIRSFTSRSAGIIGAALGGLLATWTSPSVALLIDFVTYLVSIGTLIGVHDEAPAKTGEKEASLLEEAWSGIRYVWSRRWMAAVMIQGTVQLAFVFGPVTILLPLMVGGEKGTWYGMVVAAEAVGALLGAAIGGVLRPARRGLTATLALFAQLAQTLGLALHAPPWLLAVLSALAGAGMSVFAVLWISALYSEVPREYQGRVFSVDLLANSALTPVGLMLSGWMLGFAGESTLAWFATGLMAVSTLAVLPIPGVLHFSDPKPSSDVRPTALS